MSGQPGGQTVYIMRSALTRPGLPTWHHPGRTTEGGVKRSPLRRTGRLKPVSAKKAKEYRESRPVVAEVFERDGGCVLRTRTDEWGPCFGDLTPHHLRKASAGGSYTLNQLIALCECHNGAVEDWPAAAKAWGLVVNHAITSIEAYRRRELHGIGLGSYPEEAP